MSLVRNLQESILKFKDDVVEKVVGRRKRR